MNSQKVYLYGETAVGTLDLPSLAAYIESLLPGMRVGVRAPFITWHLSPLSPVEQEQRLTHLAMEFARAKIRTPEGRNPGITPLLGEVHYEKRRLSAAARNTFGILYDGFEVMHFLVELMSREERGLDSFHIAFTNQLLGTREEDDRRYHARVAIFGYPSLLSTSGTIEAPAKPREYYLLKQRYQALRMNDPAILGLDSHFRDRFLDYEDETLTEVMKGYVMQALFYHLTGNPFCKDQGCRLYNAHWQEEVIQAQLKGNREFCPFHEQELQRLRKDLAKQERLRSTAE
ncbi:DUF6775 family putative metallopeptidase [Chloroflexota bacterium]